MQSLTLEGKIIVFKALAISKLVYLSITIKVPTEIIVELEKIQKRFVCPTKPKIKNKTLSYDFILQKYFAKLETVSINRS